MIMKSHALPPQLVPHPVTIHNHIGRLPDVNFFLEVLATLRQANDNLT